MNRRNFIKKSIFGIAGIGILGGLYTWQIEPFMVDFVKLPMPIKNLPKELNGKILMQISDIHIGNRFNHKFIIESFKEANKFNPDIVVYTGDYVSTYKDEVLYDKLIETINNSVKGKIGTFGILGNHDYGKNWKQATVADKITELLTSGGINVLRNQSVNIEGLNIIGLDDYWGLNFNPTEALSNFDSSQANLVLCHNPDVCDLDIWGNYDSWILAGHTHGGQVKPPFLSPPMLPVKNKLYSSGLFKLSNDRTLYINRALGHLWQVRFNARPEITIFKLQTA